MNPNECRNLRATPSDVKHFLTTPAVRFPALVPDAGMLCFSRSVLDFESSLHVRNFFRYFISAGARRYGQNFNGSLIFVAPVITACLFDYVYCHMRRSCELL